MALSIDDLLALDDRPVTTVHVDAWDADVHVRVMDGKERDSLAAMQANGKTPSNAEMRKALLLRGVCDADGKRWAPEKIEKLAEKSGNALEQLMASISDLNGLTEESRKRLMGKQEAN